MADRIEIRMFGRFFVRRADGEVIDDDEWSTGKTTDLLRILALSAGRNVGVNGILEKLWPDVDDGKAHASLRTAASRIRRVLGAECIDRHLGGLVLRNAWVDVVAFQNLVHDARIAMHAHDHSRVVSIAREAESLYVADFRTHDDKSTWSIEARDALRMSRQSLLADAAESAVHLLWMRDAIDFSNLAIAADSCFERPHRLLMRAHAGLGETELALRAFEHCRVNLSQELGADPSPQTRALHLQILTGDIAEVTLTPFTGRETQVKDLSITVAESISGDACDVVCVSGPPGSGRTALLQAAAVRVPHAHLRHLVHDGPSASYAWQLASSRTRRRSDIVVCGNADSEPQWEANRLLALLDALDPDTPRVLAIITSDATGDLLERSLAPRPEVLHRLSTGPLADPDLADLAATSLSGPATPRLLEELRRQSGGLAGKAVTILHEWIASGWIISTQSGLDLYNDAAAVTGMAPVGDTFRTLLEQLSPQEMDFCLLLTMVDQPVTADLIVDLQKRSPAGMTMSVDEIQFGLDQLTDLGILRFTHKGYALRNLALRDAFHSWLRPSVRARLFRDFGDLLDPGGQDLGRPPGP